MRERQRAIAWRQRCEERDVHGADGQKRVERFARAQVRLAIHPQVLIERLRLVDGRGQCEPCAGSEGQFALRQMDQHLADRPLAGRVAALELLVCPAREGAESSERVAHRLDRIAVAEIGGVRCLGRHACMLLEGAGRSGGSDGRSAEAFALRRYDRRTQKKRVERRRSTRPSCPTYQTYPTYPTYLTYPTRAARERCAIRT